MTRKRHGLLSLFLLSVAFPLDAQIIPDDTLGNENSLVRPINPTTELIQGGATRGVNLFHSFQEFSIKEGNRAVFDNPEGIQTIFSRVTGQNPSRLFGTLGVLGSANLFFINPNGIIFGPNAQIAVTGSFVASTANQINFPDGSRFSATNPESSSLLTIDVAVPVGLQFEGDGLGTIINLGNIASGQNIALIGGTVVTTGQILTSSEISILTGVDEVILDPSGKVLHQTNLVSNSTAHLFDFVKQEGEISGLTINDSGQVQVIQSRTLAETGDLVVEGAIGGSAIAFSSANDLKLVNSLLQIVAPEGKITLSAQDHLLIEGSGIFNSNLDQQNNIIFDGNSGDIVLRSGGDITASNSLIQTQGLLSGDLILESQKDISITNSIVYSQNLSQDSSATGGELKITAKNLLVTDAFVITNTEGTANAGQITVKVQDFTTNYTGIPNLLAGGFAGIFGSGSSVNATGNVGDINIETQELKITGGSQLLANLGGAGKGGNISITANSIEIIGTSPDDLFNSTLFSVVSGGSTGNGGNLSIKTNDLLVGYGGQIGTGTVSLGQAGNLNITAHRVELLGTPSDTPIPTSSTEQVRASLKTVITTGVGPDATGNGGNLTITTDMLKVTNGAQIQSGTFGVGHAGKIEITAQSIELRGATPFRSGLFASTSPNTTGNGGGIEIKADNLSVVDGAAISAETGGAGQAGNIRITTNRLINDNGGFITTTVGETSTTLEQGGNITINASEINLLNRSGLLAQTRSVASGGAIVLQPRDDTLSINLQDSQISATSTGTGVAGDISIRGHNITLNQSSISAQTASNTGGNITLNLDNLLILENNSQISTTAGEAQAGGDGGNINISTEFIIANNNENSDITANAFTGRGGNIQITTNGIFGLEVRNSLTSLSDLTASSQFGLAGTIILNTAGIDPTRGLETLSEETVNPEITQGCQVNRSTNAAFYNLGRGGLPSSPDELLNDNEIGVLMPWVEDESEPQPMSSLKEGTRRSQFILPCQSW